MSIYPYLKAISGMDMEEEYADKDSVNQDGLPDKEDKLSHEAPEKTVLDKLEADMEEMTEDIPGEGFKTDPEAEVEGSTFSGKRYLSTINKLVQAFGEPPYNEGATSHTDVSVEWRFSDSQGNIYTLYDLLSDSPVAANSGSSTPKTEEYAFYIGMKGLGDPDKFKSWLDREIPSVTATILQAARARVF